MLCNTYSYVIGVLTIVTIDCLFFVRCDTGPHPPGQLTQTSPGAGDSAPSWSPSRHKPAWCRSIARCAGPNRAPVGPRRSGRRRRRCRTAAGGQPWRRARRKATSGACTSSFLGARPRRTRREWPKRTRSSRTRRDGAGRNPRHPRRGQNRSRLEGATRFRFSQDIRLTEAPPSSARLRDAWRLRLARPERTILLDVWGWWAET